MKRKRKRAPSPKYDVVKEYADRKMESARVIFILLLLLTVPLIMSTLHELYMPPRVQPQDVIKTARAKLTATASTLTVEYATRQAKLEAEQTGQATQEARLRSALR